LAWGMVGGGIVVGGAVGGWVGAGATEITKQYINQSRAWLSSLYYIHNKIRDLNRNLMVKEKGHTDPLWFNLFLRQ